MTLIERRAQVTWQGSLTKGKGSITTGSGALQGLPVTWASRVERPDGKTNPEELLAAAEAECYVMVLSHMLTSQGHEPQSLEVAAVCSLQAEGESLKITTLALDVTGKVDGITDEQFKQITQEAEKNCPVSATFRGNVTITVNAHLSS